MPFNLHLVSHGVIRDSLSVTVVLPINRNHCPRTEAATAGSFTTERYSVSSYENLTAEALSQYDRSCRGSSVLPGYALLPTR